MPDFSYYYGLAQEARMQAQREQSFPLLFPDSNVPQIQEAYGVADLWAISSEALAKKFQENPSKIHAIYGI